MSNGSQVRQTPVKPSRCSQQPVIKNGGNAIDNLSFSAPAANVAAGGSLSVELNGNNGKDVVAATFGGQLLGDFTLLATGGNGKDEVSSNLTFDAGSTGNVDATVKGGNGKDDLTLMAVDNSGDDGDPTTTDASTLASLTASVDGGLGPDSATVSDNVDVTAAKTTH